MRYIPIDILANTVLSLRPVRVLVSCCLTHVMVNTVLGLICSRSTLVAAAMLILNKRTRKPRVSENFVN